MQMGEKAYFGSAGDFLTLRHLVLHGTNYQIGQTLGELAIQRYGKNLDSFSAHPEFSSARRWYFSRNYPVHLERVRGVAAVFGVDPQDDRYDFTNLMYNVDLPFSPPGCSVVYYPPTRTATGGGYLSRNYDFSTGSITDVMPMLSPPGAAAAPVPIMSEPYLMEWHPQDGGYASLSMQAFDLLSGTLDGINSAGLVVSILADEEAIARLGPNLEVQMGSPRVTGLHELQVMRLLLDTCASAAEAKRVLLGIKQYYCFVPCHYIIADRGGDSFIYENSTGRNVQHIVDGNRQPQIITNFQVHRHPDPNQMPGGPLTLETNAFWRYLKLRDQISAHPGLFTAQEMKDNNSCVNIIQLVEEMRLSPASHSIAAGIQSRTLWHALYDQLAGGVEFSFYLGEQALADGRRLERRSEYLGFTLEA